MLELGLGVSWWCIIIQLVPILDQNQKGEKQSWLRWQSSPPFCWSLVLCFLWGHSFSGCPVLSRNIAMSCSIIFPRTLIGCFLPYYVLIMFIYIFKTLFVSVWMSLSGFCVIKIMYLLCFDLISNTPEVHILVILKTFSIGSGVLLSLSELTFLVNFYQAFYLLL